MDTLNLSQEQEEKLINGFAQIAVLIGAADGEMDEEERSWSKKIAHIRTFSGQEILFDFYKKLDTVIEAKIEHWLHRYPDNPEERERVLVDNLQDLNAVLAELPPNIAYYLYRDMRSYANHIARASGGFLRFFSISTDEKEFVELPMLDELVWEEEE